MKSLTPIFAEWLVRLEFIWLVIALPFLLFPNSWTPWFFLLLLLPGASISWGGGSKRQIGRQKSRSPTPIEDEASG